MSASGTISIGVRATMRPDPNGPARGGEDRGEPVSYETRMAGFMLADGILSGLESRFPGRFERHVNVISVRFIESPAGFTCMVKVVLQITEQEELIVPEEQATILPYSVQAHAAAISVGVEYVLQRIRAALERNLRAKMLAARTIQKLFGQED